MVTCETCGMAVPEGNSFCTSCGAVITPLHPYSGNPAPEGQEAKSGTRVTWSRKIPLITNPWLVLQCICIPLGIGIAAGILSPSLLAENGPC